MGVDTIVARAGVAKMTLYNNYPSKDELALAFLRDREARWTRGWLEEEVGRRGRAPRDKLLAVFDLFDEWFRRADFEACSFVRALLEHDLPEHPVRRAAVSHIESIRLFLRQLAHDAGIGDADGFAWQWQILMIGSIIAARAGEVDAARRAKAAGLRLLGRS